MAKKSQDPVNVFVGVSGNVTRLGQTNNIQIGNGTLNLIVEGPWVGSGFYKCAGCGEPMGFAQGDSVIVQAISGLIQTWCWDCSHYDYGRRRFKTLEDDIRDSLPYLKDMPSLMLADYLEEHGAAAADYIRKHAGGE